MANSQVKRVPMIALSSYKNGWSRQVAHSLAIHANAAYNGGIGTLIEDKDTDTQCYLKDYGNHAVLAFRGTEPTHLNDVLSDLDMRKVVWHSGTSLVHSGFAKAFESVRPRIEELLSGLSSVDNLFITGHSLGGALATLAADSLNCKLVTTFGSPRVGDRTFARQFELKLAGKYFRVFNRSDVVARVPTFVRFKHVGTPVFIDHRGLVWIRPSWYTRLVTFWRNVVTGAKVSLVRDHAMTQYLASLE